ncbi:hypothetical protein DT065_05950 [Salicibibacter kimchii]|uniref:Uncharacterized protein n=1 Tax=Salicibibacter kimchii TaxID=2099786 RepID=A0A345BXC8_9BACI|nr:hypothetical protein DT065_05950 [Salicibibacter kimchii]
MSKGSNIGIKREQRCAGKPKQARERTRLLFIWFLCHCFSEVQSLLSRNLLDAFLCSVCFLDQIQFVVRYTKIFEGSTTTSMARSAPALRASPAPNVYPSKTLRDQP